MIRDDRELSTTFEQLAKMYAALAALDRRRSEFSDSWYAVMTEGPLEEIRRMEADIGAYTGKTAAERAQATVWLGIRGSGIQWPATPTSVLTTFLDTLRKGVQAGAELLSTGDLSTRPTEALRRRCDLEILHLQPGSVQVGVRLPDPEKSAEEPLARHAADALECYVMVASWAGSGLPVEALDELVPRTELRRVLLTEVKRLVPRPRGGVEAVDLSGPLVPADLQTGGVVTLRRATHERVDAALDRAAAEQVESHTGTLREIDLDKRSFTLRNLEDSTSAVGCTFDPELYDTAIAALDRRVEVHGVRAVVGGRARGALHVTRLTVVDGEDAAAP